MTYSNSSGSITLAAKEAKVCIKSNKLLEESGWRFFDPATGKANIVVEPKAKLTKAAIDRA
jgi:type I restriction enzyme, R subunit